MTGFLLVLFVAVPYALYCMFVDRVVNPRPAVSMKELARLELQRSKLGDLRTRMFHAILKGDLDLNRSIPSLLYRGTTVLMRRPFDHKRAAEAFTTHRPEPESSTSESDTPTPVELAYAAEFFKIIDELCRGELLHYALTARVRDLRPSHLHTWMVLSIPALQRQEEEQIKAEIRASIETMKAAVPVPERRERQAPAAAL